MTSSVAIFRKRMLSYSETFIAGQGRFLPSYRPLFCGFQRDPSGLHLLDGSTRILLEEHSNLPALSKLLFRHGLGGGKRWLGAIARENPALVHAHFFNDGIDALRIAARLDVPLVTTVHGHDITKHDNAQDAGSRDFFERVDRIIAVSDFIAAQALARGCPEHKLVQHYIGIDLDQFTRPKLESEEPSLLFVGRLVEKKGCIYLLQAMQQLQSRFADLKLTIVGSGELQPALEREVSERRLNVEFAGTASADEIRDRLARSWLFVAPSITAQSGDAEGLGMVFLEAQALQTPVVSFSSGGVVEAVENGVTGLLCAEKDVDALARNIASLLQDETLRRSMGNRGRQRVEEHFDLRKQCAKLERIYSELR